MYDLNTKNCKDCGSTDENLILSWTGGVRCEPCHKESELKKFMKMVSCETCNDGPWWDRPITNIIATDPECVGCDNHNRWKARKVLSTDEAIDLLKAKSGMDDAIKFLMRRQKWKKKT